MNQRSGTPKTQIFKHGGWTFLTTKSHILHQHSQQHPDHFSWKRELNCFQGQSLPDAIFPKNSLEIIHDETGIRIRFGALEALRAWASLELDPVKALDAGSQHWRQHQHRMNGIPLVDYDYTYTTLYSGGTDSIDSTSSTDDNDCIPSNYDYLQIDSTSFVAKKVRDDDNSQKLGGPARLREPICKCKGDGGRAPFIQNKTSTQTEGLGLGSPDKHKVFTPNNKSNPNLTPPPQWEKNTSHDKVDIETMLRKFPQPLCYEIIDLYEDELHENGICFLKAKIFVTPIGWAGLLRFFVRVDGVMARVIDTRFIHYFGETRVLRERSWREGSWNEFLGEEEQLNDVTANSTTTVHPAVVAPAYGRHATSLESANDSLAARVLPLKEPAITESLVLEKKESISCGSTNNDNLDESGVVIDESLQFQSHCLRTNATSDSIICPISPLSICSTFGICMVTIREDGVSIDAIPPTTSHGGVGNLLTTTDTHRSLLWTKSLDSDVENKMTAFLSLQVSSDTTDGGRLVVGDDRGWGHIWRLSTGEPLFTFPIANESVRARCNKRNITNARLWVDTVIWSKCGTMIGAAAGRSAVLVSALNGQVVSSIELMEGSITDIAFRNQSLGIASYGIVKWLTKDKDHNKDVVPREIKRAGVSIQCIDVSPNGTWVALGFLDKTMRLVNTMGGNSNSGGNEGGCKPLSSDCNNFKRNVVDDAIDWVGFNAPVKLVCFSEKGNWLAAMGGSSILIIPLVGFNYKSDAPIVCRTHGQTTSDGCDGTCERFLSFVWSSSEENILFAVDVKSVVHIFDVTKTDQAWPRRTFPFSTVIQ